jgi:hypothetical protein
MVPKTQRLFVSLAIAWSIAASRATAQAPHVPAARLHPSAAYDDTRQQVVLYGGLTWNSQFQKTEVASDVWGWNGRTWSRISETGTRKYVASMAFDSKRHRLVSFGGANDTGVDGNSSLWTQKRGVLSRISPPSAAPTPVWCTTPSGTGWCYSAAGTSKYCSPIHGNLMALTGRQRLPRDPLFVLRQRWRTTRHAA